MNLKKVFIVLSIIGTSLSVYSQTCSCFLTVDSSYQIVPLILGPHPGTPPLYQCGDCSSTSVPLPFSFCFYGKNYDTVYINAKGSISFHKPVYNFTNVGLPQGKDTLTLDAFLADVYDSLTPGEIYYKISPTNLIVQWNTVGYQTFDCDLYDNFQVIITNGTDPILSTGNNVSYCYWLMKWATGDSSGGSGGFFGVPAKVGVSKGDGIHFAQFGTFNYHGYTYYGPYDTLSELYWIDNKSFTFNTCVSGNNIPPVIVNSDSCSIDTVCAGDTLSFGTTFLCSELGQKAVLTVSSPGMSGLTSDTVSANSLYHTTIQVVAKLADTGTHTVTVTATDNSAPPLTNSSQYTVIIKNCDTTKAAGINKVVTGNSSFSIFPNPNKGKFTIQITNHELQITDAEVFNLLGEQVYAQLLTPRSSLQIDLSSQYRGIYFIKLFSENTMIGVQKVVVQ